MFFVPRFLVFYLNKNYASLEKPKVLQTTNIRKMMMMMNYQNILINLYGLFSILFKPKTNHYKTLYRK